MDSKTGARDYVGVRKGLAGNQSLGELESQILDIIWGLDEEDETGGKPISTTQVFKVMYPRRELSYSTIMLTMSKLARKGFLDQTKTGDKKTDAFVYRPKVSRNQMTYDLFNVVAQTLHRGKDAAEVVAHLQQAGLLP